MAASKTRAVFFTFIQLLFAAFLYLLGVTVIGLAISPGAMLVYYTWINIIAIQSIPLKILIMCLSSALAYFIYGFTLILILWLLRITFRLNLK